MLLFFFKLCRIQRSCALPIRQPYKYSMDGHMFITSAMYGDMKRIEALLAKGTTDVDGADFVSRSLMLLTMNLFVF